MREANPSVNAGGSVNADCPGAGAASGEDDAIHFNIAGAGVHTIAPASALPTIAAPVLIDGYTQPGSAQNSSDTGWNGTLLIELDGVGAAGDLVDGLELTAPNTTVRGLAIVRFSRSGISIGPGVASQTFNQVVGNFVGLRADGTTPGGNGTAGIAVSGLGRFHEVGGLDPAQRNVVANNNSGIQVNGSNQNSITNNFIGTDASGTLAQPNFVGVVINQASLNSVRLNRITGNTNVGVEGLGDLSQSNSLRTNVIFDNGARGIDLLGDGVTANDLGDADSGPNGLQNFPALTSASTSGLISGTISTTANTAIWIQFYSSLACDSSGFGEGATFLSETLVNTDGSGNAAFDFAGPPLTAGQVVTATAGNLSEFSACVTITAPPALGPLVTPNSPLPDTTTFLVGQSGGPAFGNITFNVSGGVAPGTTQINCQVTTGTIEITANPSQVIGVGESADAVQVSFASTATPQSGVVFCQFVREGFGNTFAAYTFKVGPDELFKDGFE